MGSVDDGSHNHKAKYSPIKDGIKGSVSRPNENLFRAQHPTTSKYFSETEVIRFVLRTSLPSTERIQQVSQLTVPSNGIFLNVNIGHFGHPKT